MARDPHPIIFIVGQYFHQLIATFHVCAGCTFVFFLSFPRIEFISFFIQKPSHIPLLLLRYTPSLESETKTEFLHLLSGKTLFSPLMVDFDFIRKETPSVSFFFARLGVFLESFGGHRPHVGLFIPRDCGAFRPILIGLYPLLYCSLIAHHLEMTAIEYKDSDVRSSELETGLPSSGESTDKDFEIVMSKPPSSSKSSSSSSRLCLGGGEGMEWNGIKGIFLEYSSLFLFGSFNGGNGMYIPLFGSLSGREWNG